MDGEGREAPSGKAEGTMFLGKPKGERPVLWAVLQTVYKACGEGKLEIYQAET